MNSHLSARKGRQTGVNHRRTDTSSEAAALPTRLDADMLGRMEISTWRTDAGDFDVLTDIPAGDGHRLRYDELVGRAMVQDVNGAEARPVAARSGPPACRLCAAPSRPPSPPDRSLPENSCGADVVQDASRASTLLRQLPFLAADGRFSW